MESFEEFFHRLTGHAMPHDWQVELIRQSICANRLIRIPTGFGKTLGILAVWLWHRVIQRDESWPRRLIWCLPMRVLVEQTAEEVRLGLESIGLFWAGGEHAGKVGVHLLMGGADGGDWQLYPEECAVLIGTQDMLLSRALNRGYGAARARWPMEFGLLSQDALWVMDEVQLMDVGLATSAQLQAFRDDDATTRKLFRPVHTWWMSATLQESWLKKSPDTAMLTSGLPPVNISAEARVGRLWDDVEKPCRLDPVKDAKAIAKLVASEHAAAGKGERGPTLVVLNRVQTAVTVYAVLAKEKSLTGTDIRLIHSRFRPAERAGWRSAFLNRNACAPGTDRIIVATQVIEAGVDISAALLVTELAPWASSVQRFGRAARWGGIAQVIVVDTGPKDDKAAAPYAVETINAAREALSQLSDVAPKSLEVFEEEHADLLPRLYPFEPTHLLLRHELDELFDTTPDLSGTDIDISRFIRSGDERDLQVFWEEIAEKGMPPDDLRLSREALCAVPFFAAKAWLCGKNNRLNKGMHAWVWDWLEGTWRTAEGRDFYPGQTLLVAAQCGGYDMTSGWDEGSSSPVPTVSAAVPQTADMADAAQDDESLSRAASWQTIATHGREVGRLAGFIAGELIPEHSDLYDLGGRIHDIGKSHVVAFQSQIVDTDRPDRNDLAKAPDPAWARNKGRRGYRHELATVLALFDVLQRHDPDHPALLGPWRDFLAAAGMEPVIPLPSSELPTPIEQEVLALSAEHFNLLLYLVCAHHGKVRLTWHACPADQKATDTVLRIRGIRDGEVLPPLPLFTADGSTARFPESRLDLLPAAAGLNPRTGPGWTERVLSLLATYGPFGLAWHEAIMRAADQRVSMTTVAADDLLSGEVMP